LILSISEAFEAGTKFGALRTPLQNHYHISKMKYLEEGEGEEDKNNSSSSSSSSNNNNNNKKRGKKKG